MSDNGSTSPPFDDELSSVVSTTGTDISSSVGVPNPTLAKYARAIPTAIANRVDAIRPNEGAEDFNEKDSTDG